MNKIKSLRMPQKIILLILAAMVVVFSILYPITISREGYEYLDSILVQKESGENTVYSGKIRGRNAEFTVTPDKTVVFRYGDATYGPYTVREDPTAIPKENPFWTTGEFEETGLVIQRKGETIFRGCRIEYGPNKIYYNEDGSSVFNFRPIPEPGSGVIYDTDMDILEPSILDILKLTDGPQLTHKGNGLLFFFGVVICALTALSVIFADELFRWNLRYVIVDADNAEPTDWTIMSRYISWAILIIAALVLFIGGLK